MTMDNHNPMDKSRILIVDDEEEIRRQLKWALAGG